MKDTVSSSEMLVSIHHTTWWYILEDSHLLYTIFMAWRCAYIQRNLHALFHMKLIQQISKKFKYHTLELLKLLHKCVYTLLILTGMHQTYAGIHTTKYSPTFTIYVETLSLDCSSALKHNTNNIKSTWEGSNWRVLIKHVYMLKNGKTQII
jgi:hypothetical protein